MVRKLTSSASSVASALLPWPLGAAICCNSTERTHSLSVCPRAEASASSCAYSDSVILVPRDLLRSGGFKQPRPPGKEQPLQLPQQGTPKRFSELPSGNSKFPYSNPLHKLSSF